MANYEIAGRVSYGSMVGVSQMSYTRSRGIQPGVIQFSVPELPTVPDGVAPVFFTDGTRQFVIADCLLQSVDIDYSNGVNFVLTLLDYRWKWKYGQISGSYNTVIGGTIQTRTRKTPRELATLCLIEMGVKKYDVKALPNDPRPEVTWDLDNPAVALESLCSALGCIVCPQLNGDVLICKQGVGKRLPAMKGAELKESIKIEQVPDDIYISAEPTLWEVSLELGDPVGLETDGRIVPIDQLSYTPKDAYGVKSWKTEDPGSFVNVELKYRPLALQSVWKWYRVKVPISLPGLILPDNVESTITNPAQIFFGDSCLYKETLLGEKKEDERRKDTFAYGKYYDRQEKGDNNVEKFSHDFMKVTAADKVKSELIYKGSFSIDKDKILFMFSDAVFLYESKGDDIVFVKPDLRVRTAIGFKRPDSDAKYREVYKQPTKRKNNTKPMWVRRSDVRRELIIDAKTGSPYQGLLGDNKETVIKQLETYAAYELQKISPNTPQQGDYSGFIDIELDGTIEQVTYSIDGAGFTTTTASYGTEHSLIVPTFDERKRMDKLNTYLKEQEQIQNGKQEPGKRR